MGIEKNFRNTTWGMSKEEVKKSETNAKLALEDEDTDSIFYLGTIVGCKAIIYYKFTNGQLSLANYDVGRTIVSSDAGYEIVDSDDDISDIKAYCNLLELLSKKYGEPETAVDLKHPNKKFPLTTYGEGANAVASGLVAYRHQWTTTDTSILLICQEDKEKYNVIVRVIYTDIKRIDTSTEDDTDKDLENL